MRALFFLLSVILLLSENSSLAQENPGAKYNNIGVMYRDGQKGIARDYEEAMRWFRSAAVQEDAIAQLSIGSIYLNGQGAPVNYWEALTWFRLAADQGNATVQRSIGYMYANGKGVAQDYEEALSWFQLAADQGDILAQGIIREMYTNEQDISQRSPKLMSFSMWVLAILAAWILFRWLLPSNRNRDQLPSTTNPYESRDSFYQKPAHQNTFSNNWSSTEDTSTSITDEEDRFQDLCLPTDWWLCSPNLACSKHLTAVFCLGYRIGQSDDDWTVRINNFKKGKPYSVKKAEATVYAAASSLFRRMDIDPDDTVVIPALNSKQTSGSANSKNSRLAKAIANGAGANFVWNSLRKNRHEPLHHQSGVQARDQALSEANYRASKLRCENVIIVDDIVTRGATMSTIAKAILRSNPNVKVFGFALGRHIRPEYSHSQANAEIPHELADIWDHT